MTALSDYLENQLLRWALTTEALGAGSPALARPTAWHVALYSAATTDAGGGTELTGGSYARQAVTFSVTNSAASNTADINFVSSADWPNITHIGIWTAASGGSLLFHGALTTPRDPSSGDTIRLAAGQLILTLD